MSSKHELIAVSLAVALLLSVAAPAFAATETADDELAVGVTQSDGVAVTVTSNGTAVGNASVGVEAMNNSTYVGTGSYVTDANGTVELPAPEENATVRVVAEKGNRTAVTTATLTVTGESEEEADAFGQRVSAFVHGLLSDEDVENPGRIVSAWVIENNPGAEEKPDHAGPPEDRKGERGPPDHAGPGDDGDDQDDGDDGDEDGDDAERSGHPGKGNGKRGR